ncbi:MAG: prepilin peptidase, partial [Gammaproteobacteria bacterium]|nr:prepilin peptidase [Gammaproteobacteria bacterium]
MTHRLQSSSIHDLRPGLVSGSYPERTEKKRDFFSRSGQGILALAQSLTSSLRNFDSILAAIHAHGQQLEKLNDALLQQRLAEIRSLLYREGLSREHVILAFALIREVAGRTVGMRHFDSQLMGGWVMIQGMLAEMETGEGKTLTATLAAATAGLAGIPVHVITVNDYLVKRDADLMKPVYQALGLSVGVVTTEMSGDDRRNAYRCDITYCSNKQITFDYLRDRITLGNDHGRRRLQLECLHKESPRLDTLFLRGLCFAIVDEADSVLIDEARTPLIISRKQECPDENEIYKQAISLAEALDHESDFRVRQKERRIDITERGKEQLTARTLHLGGIWNGTRRREELVGQALSALFLFQRDKHYLIHDGKVVIIDENTGRVMPDRSWERGLHQMIEVKEDC